MSHDSRARAGRAGARTRSALVSARRRARPVASRTARLTAAAVIAYLAALALFPGTQPLTGPLTALLVVQATLFSTLTTGLRRVISVVAGVLVAVLLSSVVGLTWWSLAVVIAAALVIGQLLRLGEHLLEVPISAMLVLGVSSVATSAATSRVAETLVGAGVGVLVNLLFPPSLRTRSAGASVERVATEAAALIDRAANELPAGVTRAQALGWLQDFRDLSRHVDRADQAVNEAAESRRLNPRAVGLPDAQPMLRSGLDSLEHSTVALRALFRSIADGVPETEPATAREADSGPGPGGDTGSDAQGGATGRGTTAPVSEGIGAEGYDEALREAFAALLAELAACVRAFGALTRAEAETSAKVSGTELATALDAVREARAMLTELLLVDPGESPDLWLLRGSLLAAVERVLRELDVQEREHRRERWRRDQAARGRTTLAVSRLRDSSRQLADRPRRHLRRRGGP